MAYKFQIGQANLSGSIVATDDDSFDLGSSSKQYRDLYLDGTANIDSLVADTADINGGTIDGATIATSDITVGSGKTLNVSNGTLTTSAAQNLAIMQGAGANVDIGSFDMRAQTLTADGLTATRLVFAGANGVLSDDSGLTFANGFITGSISGSIVAAGAAQFADLGAEGLNVDNDADVGGALSAGSISGSASLSIGGTVRFDGVAEVAAVATDKLYFMDSDNLMKKDTLSAIRDLGFSVVSGDATIANGGALTIANSAVELAMMAANSIDSDQYVDGSIDRAHLAADIVDGSKIADDAVDSEHIAAGAIDLAHMSANSVDSDQYVDGSIDTAHIADAQITLAKMADNSVDSDQYVDGSIDLVHMSANSVDSDQYVDGSVDNIHLANSAITLTQGAGMAAMGSVSLGSAVTVAVDGVLADLDTLGASSADGEFIVATGAGAFAYESGNTARTSLGLGTSNSPQFTGLTLTGNLVVQGSTTTIDSTTINISSSFLFEGPADDHETELNCAVPVADTTLNLPTLSAGTYYIPALADAATDASAAVTAAEFALLDGGSTVSRVTVADADGFLFNDGGTMKQVDVRDVAKYVGDNLAESIDSISSDETLSDFSGGKILLVNSSGGDVTVTLPASANHAGEIVKVKKISVSNNVILEGNASETLDGLDNITLESPRAALSLISDGSNWFVM